MDEMRDHVSEDGAQEDTKKKKSPFSKKHVIPSKKQINFADIGKTEMKLSVLIPGIILIIAGASLLSKFLVVDRIMEVSALQSEVSTLRSQIDEEQAVIDSMQDVAIKFAHYTWSDMTDEERNLADRMEAVKLIDKYVRSEAEVGSYTISGNEISLPITGVTFREIGHIVSALESDPLVNHCEVVAAASDDSGIVYDSQDTDITMIGGNMEATAQVTVYLNDSPTEPDAVSEE